MFRNGASVYSSNVSQQILGASVFLIWSILTSCGSPKGSLEASSQKIANSGDFRYVENLTISTFNIKNFDGRQPNLGHTSEYVYENINADIIAFQEINDVNSLRYDLLNGRYDCVDDGSSDDRQNVVLCVKKPYRLKRSNDNNFALESIQFQYYRPAIHGVVVNEYGSDVLHVFAVHLKAAPQSSNSALRAKQLNILGDFIEDLPRQTGVAIIGDINTWYDDAENFRDLVGEFNRHPLQEPYYNFDYSYRTSRMKHHFDRLYHSSHVKIRRTYVPNPCNFRSDSGFDLLKEHNRYVSDHCAVSFDISVFHD